MSQNYWQQQIDKPLFSELLWSRPETKMGAGKLLIIGGQSQEFIHVAESFAAAEKNGAGSIRVLMPDSTYKVTKVFSGIEYAPSNQSGSFSKAALSELIDGSKWADGVLLAGDLGKNSETNLMIDSYIRDYSGLLIISPFALPSITTPAQELARRPNTVPILQFRDLQKLAIDVGFKTAVTSTMGNVDFAKLLHELSQEFSLDIIVSKDKFIWVASRGRVSSTKIDNDLSRVKLAALVAVWAIQNPTKFYEAATTATYCVSTENK